MDRLIDLIIKLLPIAAAIFGFVKTVIKGKILPNALERDDELRLLQELLESTGSKSVAEEIKENRRISLLRAIYMDSKAYRSARPLYYFSTILIIGAAIFLTWGIFSCNIWPFIYSGLLFIFLLIVFYLAKDGQKEFDDVSNMKVTVLEYHLENFYKGDR